MQHRITFFNNHNFRFLIIVNGTILKRAVTALVNEHAGIAPAEDFTAPKSWISRIADADVCQAMTENFTILNFACRAVLPHDNTAVVAFKNTAIFYQRICTVGNRHADIRAAVNVAVFDLPACVVKKINTRIRAVVNAATLY